MPQELAGQVEKWSGGLFARASLPSPVSLSRLPPYPSPMHLYIHVPFCARRCSYCDFAIAVRRSVPAARFVQRVLEEWGTWQEHPAWNDSPTLDTVYFGGGTPSLLEPELIGKLLETVNRSRGIVAGAEVTLEANPDDVDAKRAASWRGRGSEPGFARGAVLRAAGTALDASDSHPGAGAGGGRRSPQGGVREHFPGPHLRSSGGAGAELGGRPRGRTGSGPRPPLALRSDRRVSYAL